MQITELKCQSSTSTQTEHISKYQWTTGYLLSIAVAYKVSSWHLQCHDRYMIDNVHYAMVGSISYDIAYGVH